MILSDYINSVLDEHELKYEIEIDNHIRKSIISDIKKDIFAFQIIYSPSLGNHRYMMVVKVLKPLDVTKVKSSNVYYNDEILNTLYSYDGNDNFKYSERETILFDKSIIRNLKLDNILQK